MFEILLSHPEFVCLLDAINAHALVGIAPDALIPADPAQRRELIKQGEEELLSRGLLVVGSDGQRIFDVTLIAMVTVLAQPNLAAITIRHARGSGPQLFLLYQSDALTVEHTYPREDIHRLALLDAPSAMVRRLREVLALSEHTGLVTHIDLPQDAFFGVKRLAESGQAQAGRDILRGAGFTEQSATDLVQALERPLLSGNVALIRCIGDTLTDARNVAVERGETSAWIIEQRVPGEPVLRIETGNADRLRQILERDVAQLMTPA